MLSKIISERLKRHIRQRYWTEYVSEHSEIRINQVKAFCKHWGFTFVDERFRWQNEFIHRWFVAPWSQPEVWWETLLESLDRMSKGKRRSGRTTMLALFLAVEAPIELKPYHMLDEFPDHWSTLHQANEMHRLAHELRREWYKYIGRSP